MIIAGYKIKSKATGEGVNSLLKTSNSWEVEASQIVCASKDTNGMCEPGWLMKQPEENITDSQVNEKSNYGGDVLNRRRWLS